MKNSFILLFIILLVLIEKSFPRAFSSHQHPHEHHPHHHHRHHHLPKEIEEVEEEDPHEQEQEQDQEHDPQIDLSKFDQKNIKQNKSTTQWTPEYSLHNISLTSVSLGNKYSEKINNYEKDENKYSNDINDHPISDPNEAEGVLGKLSSNFSRFIWIKEDIWIGESMLNGKSKEQMRERSMYFDGAIGAQSVVKCISTQPKQNSKCCKENDCCYPDSTFIPDGFLGLSLLSIGIFETITNKQIKNVLIIGMGGGSLPTFLQSNFKDLKITIVEIDEVVVFAARRYFGFCEDERVEVYIEDVESFMKKNEEKHQKWDIIFLDAFLSNEIPARLLKKQFLSSVFSSLNDGGVLTTNVFSMNPNKISLVVDIMRKLFSEFTIVTQLPLEMSSITYSARISESKSNSFDYSKLIQTIQGYVGRRMLPEVLSVVVNSKLLKRSFDHRMSHNSTSHTINYETSWHN